MFGFKRKQFSLRDSPVKNLPQTPSKLLALSTISSEPKISCDRRLTLTFDDLSLNAIGGPEETPKEQSPQPSKRFKSDADQESYKRGHKFNEMLAAKKQLIKMIKDHKKNLKDARVERNIIHDQADIAKKSQNTVRNLLNEIFYPAEEVAKVASETIEERRKAHRIEFETFDFEFRDCYEASKEAIAKKMKQLCHEMELHERTVMTLEKAKSISDREHQDIEFIKQGITTLDSGMEVEVVDISKKADDNDDDCIILDGSKNMNKDEDIEYKNGINCEESNNTTLIGDDDDDTDIQGDEEESSFTPLQAQRVSSS